MQSRMDKYEIKPNKKYERTKKNTQLYESVYDDIYKDISYENMKVLDSAKEINLNKLRNMLDDKYDTRQYRTLRNYSLPEDDEDEIHAFSYAKRKSYDINDVIKEAKSKRAFIEEAKEKQKYMEYTTEIYEDELSEEEKELEELINTMVIPKQDINAEDEDLFSDLKGSDNTIVTKPIDSYEEAIEKTNEDLEKSIVKADKTFYTDSNMFTKNDFEDFSDLSDHINKESKLKKFLIILLLLVLIGILCYFLMNHFKII